MASEFPNQPPLGYITREKNISVDVDAAPLIKDIFEKYAMGTYTTRRITEYASEIGLLSRRGKKVSASVLHNMLKNPFYYGDFIWNGKLYHGIHPAIVTKELYDRVQQIFAGKQHVTTKKKRHYAYCGLLQCADCGCAITAETAKQKYVYYHCTFNKGKHNNIYVREEDLEAQYTEIFKKLHLSKVQVNRFVDIFHNKREERVDALQAENQQLEQKHMNLEREIDSALAARLEKKIDEEKYESTEKQLRSHQQGIEARLLKNKYQITNYLADALDLLANAQGAYNRFINSDREEKAILIKQIMQVSEFKDGKIIPVFKHPLDILYQIIIDDVENVSYQFRAD
jgi:hypothetical protein